MTHEEIVTGHVAAAVRSYRELPMILYHFQVKERDEPRPRAGVLRTREFIMKDAYSFDRDAEGLEVSYQKHVEAYDRIFDRLGLEWYRVEADVGMMGGIGAHEYMAPCAAGENEVALAPGYAANLEVASAQAQPVSLPPAPAAPEEVHTPGMTTIDAVASGSGPAAGALLKAFPVVVDGGEMRLVVVRGDHRVNEIKLQLALGATSAPRGPRRSPSGSARRASSGPWGRRCRSCSTRRSRPAADTSPAPTGPTCICAESYPGRDFPFESVDVRSVVAGDTVAGGVIRIEPAIEVGNLFKLGTRYSEPLRATLPRPVRCRAADLDGLLRVRPRSRGGGRGRAVRRREGDLLAPVDGPVRRRARRAGQGGQRGADVRRAPVRGAPGQPVWRSLYDDRDAGPGEKFADAELLGCPLRLTVGRRTLAGG